ncbi:MAG: [FeFe] hydrogenase H-cluster radical SAM maturase HydE [Planctomycetota bacterium]
MTRSQVIEMLNTKPAGALLVRADRARAATCGESVHLRGIIEYSNHCGRRCAYCGINADNRSLQRYRLTMAQVRTIAAEAVGRGVRTIVLQAGEDPAFTADKIAAIVETVKLLGDVAVTLSCGEFHRDAYRRMRDAGADRYLIKFETSNEALYERLHPDSRLDDRLCCIRDLADLGFQTGSGSLVGLPEQTVEDIADDLLLAVALELDMATFSPFLPHPQTPLAAETGGTGELALRTLAAARLLLPHAHIPVSTALATACDDGYRRGLQAGANVVMANLTPPDAARHYDLYPGKTTRRAGRDPVDHLRGLIESLGRTTATDRGDSLRQAPVGAGRSER